ncbi:MAG TPA: HAD family hydrolase [Chitinophagaceae bacterium]|nr:haloacid dehalogenase-like hydrolase [Chitinophagales bacterium]HPG10951.1 HAD family hydrolase [Chitinophagaceae bacterium]
MKPGIAFFDFDGTITKKDTLLEFIKFTNGSFKFALGFLINSPWLIAYKLRVISNQKAKERILKFFFGGMEASLFNDHCQKFFDQKIPQLIRQKSIIEINRLAAEDVEVVIVSASPENWVRLWAEKINADCLSTRLRIDNNRISGYILGKNCYGDEKVKRIKEKYSLSEYDQIYAYGDSKGDKQMLDLAKVKFYKPFRGNPEHSEPD